MEWLKVFTPEAAQQLATNWIEQQPLKGTAQERDYQPVCKLFLPWSAATWLVSEMSDDGLCFGLCDIGFGSPELGYFSMDEVYSVKGPGGLRVEQDLHFQPSKPLSEYASEARQKGRISV